MPPMYDVGCTTRTTAVSACCKPYIGKRISNAFAVQRTPPTLRQTNVTGANIFARVRRMILLGAFAEGESIAGAAEVAVAVCVVHTRTTGPKLVQTQAGNGVSGNAA